MKPPVMPARCACRMRFRRCAFLVAGDLAGNAEVLDGRHVDDEAAGQRNVRRDAGALLSQRLLRDLNDDFLAFPQQVADRRGGGFLGTVGTAGRTLLRRLIGGRGFLAGLVGTALFHGTAAAFTSHAPGDAVHIARTLLTQGGRETGRDARRLRPFIDGRCGLAGLLRGFAGFGDSHGFCAFGGLCVFCRFGVGFQGGIIAGFDFVEFNDGIARRLILFQAELHHGVAGGYLFDRHQNGWMLRRRGLGFGDIGKGSDSGFRYRLRGQVRREAPSPGGGGGRCRFDTFLVHPLLRREASSDSEVSLPAGGSSPPRYLASDSPGRINRSSSLTGAGVNSTVSTGAGDSAVGRRSALPLCSDCRASIPAIRGHGPDGDGGERLPPAPVLGRRGRRGDARTGWEASAGGAAAWRNSSSTLPERSRCGQYRGSGAPPLPVQLQRLVFDAADHLLVLLVILEEIGDVKERIALQADIDEGRLHSRQNARYATFVDAAGQRIFIFALEENFAYLIVFENSHAGFVAWTWTQSTLSTCNSSVGMPEKRLTLRGVQPGSGGPGEPSDKSKLTPARQWSKTLTPPTSGNRSSFGTCGSEGINGSQPQSSIFDNSLSGTRRAYGRGPVPVNSQNA